MFTRGDGLTRMRVRTQIKAERSSLHVHIDAVAADAIGATADTHHTHKLAHARHAVSFNVRARSSSSRDGASGETGIGVAERRGEGEGNT